MTTPADPAAEPKAPEAEATPAPESTTGPKELREANDRLIAENQVYKDTLLDQAFQLAGIDISKGKGATMREIYDGEAAAEEIKKFATEKFEWDFEAPREPADPVVGESIAGAQQRIEGATTTATSATPATEDAQIAEAEQKGDWPTAIALKMGKTLRKMGILPDS